MTESQNLVEGNYYSLDEISDNQTLINPNEKSNNNNNNNNNNLNLNLNSINGIELEPLGDRVCRNCHDSDPLRDLIAPCQCTGSIKWVHRRCLDQWRAISPNPTSLTQCDVCQFTYQLEYIPDEKKCCTSWRYHFYVTRDFLTLFFLVNAITTLISVAYYFADAHRYRDVFFQELGWKHPIPLLADWLYGWTTLLFFIGICAIIYGIWICCCSCCYDPSPTPTYNTYTYNSWDCYMCWWYQPMYPGYYGGGHNSGDCCGDCNSCGGGGGGSGCNCSGGGDCGGGGGSGGGDIGSALLFIVVIIVVLIVAIGIVVAICLIVIVGARIMKRHLQYLQNRDATARYIVKDLSSESV